MDGVSVSQNEINDKGLYSITGYSPYLLVLCKKVLKCTWL